MPAISQGQRTTHFPRHKQMMGRLERCSQVPAIFLRAPLASQYETCWERDVIWHEEYFNFASFVGYVALADLYYWKEIKHNTNTTGLWPVESLMDESQSSNLSLAYKSTKLVNFQIITKILLVRQENKNWQNLSCDSVLCLYVFTSSSSNNVAGPKKSIWLIYINSHPLHQIRSFPRSFLSLSS